MPFDGEEAYRDRASLFYAIRPTAQAASAMAGHRDALTPGRIVDDLHITLLPIAFGRADGLRRAPLALELASTIAHGIFDVALDRLIGAKHGALLLADDPLPSLALLREKLRSEARRRCMLPLPGRSFRPHVTLIYRRGLSFSTPVQPIRWTVDSFVLIRSIVGKGRHETLGWWPLVS